MAGLESLLDRLIRQEVEFVIVGGFAAMAHGVSLVTQDIDVCCRFTPDNLLRLQEAVKDLPPYHRMTPKQIPLHFTRENMAGVKNMYLMTDLGQLDCLSEVLGLGSFDEVLCQCEEIELSSGRCRILTLDGLIKAKSAMNRPRDNEALIELNAIKARRDRQP